ncbi:MAG TPA: hypothetical protein VF252_03275 [Gemmatimonadales bacterium]
MPPAAPVSPAITARIIHAALVLGIMMFWAVAWFVGNAVTMPVSALPERRVLYLGLFLISAVLFGAAMFSASRLAPPRAATSRDDWWRSNLGRVILIWALVEMPALLGTVAYLITHDFRTLIAPFTGLLLFVNYRPSHFVEG